MPLAYMDRIFSSMPWLILVCFFFSTWGSNSPFRSRGTDTSTSPKLVRSLLLCRSLNLRACELMSLPLRFNAYGSLSRKKALYIGVELW